jgi:hypothetical protein
MGGAGGGPARRAGHAARRPSPIRTCAPPPDTPSRLRKPRMPSACGCRSRTHRQSSSRSVSRADPWRAARSLCMTATGPCSALREARQRAHWRIAWCWRRRTARVRRSVPDQAAHSRGHRLALRLRQSGGSELRRIGRDGGDRAARARAQARGARTTGGLDARPGRLRLELRPRRAQSAHGSPRRPPLRVHRSEGHPRCARSVCATQAILAPARRRSSSPGACATR